MTTFDVIVGVLIALFLWKAVPFTIRFVIAYRRARFVRSILGPSTYRRPYYPSREQADKDRESALDSLAARYGKEKQA